MSRVTQNQTGFAAIKIMLALMLLVVVGAAGWVVYRNNHKSAIKVAVTSPAPAPTRWITCKDATEGLSFSYPSTWSTAGSTADTPCSAKNTAPNSGDYLELQSPPVSSSPYVFQLTFFATGVDNVFDTSKGQTILNVTPLSAAGSRVPLYLVAYADNVTNPTEVFGLGVTDQHYSVGQVVDYVQAVHSQKTSGDYYIFSAVLTKPGQSNGSSYSLAHYQAQPDYAMVVKIFQSLSY
jgi:hypothetical protein